MWENWGGRSPWGGTTGLLVNVLTGGKAKLKLLFEDGFILGEWGTAGLVSGVPGAENTKNTY